MPSIVAAPARILRKFDHLDMEECAIRIRTLRHTSPGVAYARRLHQKGGYEAKARMRGRVARYYLDKPWPGPLKILTMPGLWWSFERMLLIARRDGMWSGICPDATTEIIAVENDPAIFRAAIGQMPGKDMAPLELFGATAVRSFQIARYQFADVEDVLASGEQFDAGWVDWTGPVTDRRLAALAAAWPGVAHSLAITALDARYMSSTVKAQGTVAALEAVLSPGRTVELHRYGAMVHLMRVKPGVTVRLPTTVRSVV